MQETHSTTSGIITYGLGIIAAFIARMSMNDWLVFLSIVLVVLRIVYETNEFLVRRAERKRIEEFQTLHEKKNG